MDSFETPPRGAPPHVMGQPVIVTARSPQASGLCGAAPAMAAAMATATLIGVGVARFQEAPAPDPASGLDPDEIAASKAPATTRAAPADEEASLMKVSRTPLSELQEDDVILAACAMEPSDPGAPSCVRVRRGDDVIEVRLRS
jgi:hypothetical protein